MDQYKRENISAHATYSGTQAELSRYHLECHCSLCQREREITCAIKFTRPEVTDIDETQFLTRITHMTPSNKEEARKCNYTEGSEGSDIW